MKSFDQKMLEEIGMIMLKKRETIAVAESVSSGLLQFAMSNITDAAKFYQGGITVYNVPQKYKLLQVEPIHALQVNGVSQQVADQMAIHVKELFRSNWGIGVTGYASPVPESGNDLFAYYSISYNGIVASGKLSGEGKDASKLQFYYAEKIMSALLLSLKRSGDK